MKAYLYFLLFSLITFGFLFVIQFFSSYIKNRLFRYKKTEEKLEPYESGMLFKDTAYKRYGIRIFPILLLFLLFDIEAIILFPWTISAKKYGLFGMFEALIFIFVLFLGYLVVLKKGGLDIIKREKI